MDLPRLSEISLDGTSLDLIQDAQNSARCVSEFRPLPPDVVRRIEDELLGERVYSSNAIEGSTLDLRETVMILKSGVLGARKKREALEARNLGEAARMIFKWTSLGEDCNSSDKLREIHKIILQDINDEWAGRYRGPGVMIAGAKHQPPDESQVPSLMDQAMGMLREECCDNPILPAVWTHWAITRIHPFMDGNGRVGRLWQDLILSQNKLSCAVIRPQDRREYLDALTEADEGDFNALVQLVTQRIILTFDKYFVAIQQEQEEDKFISDLVGEAGARLEDSRRLIYMRWSRMMEQLRWEFETCASRISEASQDIKIQIRPFELIDQARWENLRLRLGAERTWFFILDCFLRQHRVRYFFFFGLHYWTDHDDNHDRSEQRVSLLISEDDGTGKGKPLVDIEECPITLREVFIVDNRFVRKRLDFSSRQLIYDRNVPALQIAQDFLREVVLGRLT